MYIKLAQYSITYLKSAIFLSVLSQMGRVVTLKNIVWRWGTMKFLLEGVGLIFNRGLEIFKKVGLIRKGWRRNRGAVCDT